MLLFIDGEIVILSVEQNIELYYQTYIQEFPEVSRTQWEGSKEYEIAYANAQRDHDNAVIVQQTLDKIFGTITETNEFIKRPAVLHSRVPERFAEAGYIASIRLADEVTKGIVAIAVDYERVINRVDRVLTVGSGDDGAGASYGYSSSYAGGFGALDNATYRNKTITSIRTQPENVNITQISLDAAPDDTSTFSMIIGGGQYSFTLDSGAIFVHAGVELYELLGSSDGQDITFRFPDEDSLDPETAEQDKEIAELIAFEMLPAGQHMEGAISYPVVISNGQSVNIQWKTPDIHDVDFRIELTVDRNSDYAQDDVDTIVSRFLSNFAALNQLGQDITPDAYYQIERDAPWASKIVTTYDLDESGSYTGDIYSATYDDKFIATLDAANVVIIG